MEIKSTDVISAVARKSIFYWKHPYVIELEYKIKPYKIPQYFQMWNGHFFTPVYTGDIVVKSDRIKYKYVDKDAVMEDVSKLKKQGVKVIDDLMGKST